MITHSSALRNVRSRFVPQGQISRSRRRKAAHGKNQFQTACLCQANSLDPSLRRASEWTIANLRPSVPIVRGCRDICEPTRPGLLPEDWACATLFPVLKRAFVDAQLPSEDGS